MILPKTRIISRQNEQSEYSGIDHPQQCRDFKHFVQYPYSVSYKFNSRGFRDSEWPTQTQDLQQSIWCFGDSFTSGVGVPFDHIWPQILQHKLKQRSINISLDGASNQWIARHVNYVIEEIDPPLIIIHWSYSHRRELPLKPLLDKIWEDYYKAIKDESWPDCHSWDNFDHLPDEVQAAVKKDPRFDCWTQGFDLESDRRIIDATSTAQQDLDNLQQCIDSLLPCDKIIHSFIPGWHVGPCTIDFKQHPVIDEFAIQDFARDGHHYDIKTATKFVDEILLKI